MCIIKNIKKNFVKEETNVLVGSLRRILQHDTNEIKTKKVKNPKSNLSNKEK